MYALMLAIIYAAFISLGLPDSLLGSAWPLMSVDISAAISQAGVISMIISASTITSSLLSEHLTRKLGPGLVVTLSVLLTACALTGFSLCASFIMLCVIAVPYGLGAGAIDSVLNNYVALNYESRHMNWMHCFWGLGASVGPYIMGWAVGAGHGWRTGYGTVAGIQFALTAVMFAALPLWAKKGREDAEKGEITSNIGIIGAMKIRGVVTLMIGFFGYCAFESTAGLWASSYLVKYRGVDPESAAFFAALFFTGITVGRFVCGFASDRVGDRNMIRMGVAVIAVGILMIGLPLENVVIALAGLVVIGLGAAPVYPSIIHSVPILFGRENSSAIVAVQMACAYSGSTFMPPVMGLIAQYLSIGLYPVYLMLFILLLVFLTEHTYRQQMPPDAVRNDGKRVE